MEPDRPTPDQIADALAEVRRFGVRHPSSARLLAWLEELLRDGAVIVHPDDMRAAITANLFDGSPYGVYSGRAETLIEDVVAVISGISEIVR